jgi:hypothetical protein
MEPFVDGDHGGHGGHDGHDDGLLGALRSIGVAERCVGILNPLARAEEGPAAGAPGGPGEGAPEGAALGEDNFDLLQRARGDARRHYEELQRQHQVDLNDTKNLADLEDAGLQAHMEQARALLADHERNRAALVDEEQLARGRLEIDQALSNLLKSLNDQRMELQVACDNVLLQAANAQKLAEGGLPHGYPPAGGGDHGSRCTEHLGRKLQGAGGALARIVEELKRFEQDLTLTRRTYETTVEGLARRSEYFRGVFDAATRPPGAE